MTFSEAVVDLDNRLLGVGVRIAPGAVLDGEAGLWIGDGFVSGQVVANACGRSHWREGHQDCFWKSNHTDKVLRVAGDEVGTDDIEASNLRELTLLDRRGGADRRCVLDRVVLEKCAFVGVVEDHRASGLRPLSLIQSGLHRDEIIAVEGRSSAGVDRCAIVGERHHRENILEDVFSELTALEEAKLLRVEIGLASELRASERERLILALVDRDLAAVDGIGVVERVGAIEVARCIRRLREEWNGDFVGTLQRNRVVHGAEGVERKKRLAKCNKRTVEDDIQFKFGADGGCHDDWVFGF